MKKIAKVFLFLCLLVLLTLGQKCFGQGKGCTDGLSYFQPPWVSIFIGIKYVDTLSSKTLVYIAEDTVYNKGLIFFFSDSVLVCKNLICASEKGNEKRVIEFMKQTGVNCTRRNYEIFIRNCRQGWDDWNKFFLP